MALILNIETSTKVCSAALVKDGVLLVMRESHEGMSHGTLLTVFIEQIFAETNLQAADINAVAVSEGPGSYTGLRIGVSVAKGICYAVKKPLIAVSTLKAMALMAIKKLPEQAVYCSMIDARRMEVYAALYDSALEELRPTKAEIIDAESYRDILIKKNVVFYGDGSDKCKSVIATKNAIFLPDIYPSAQYMGQLSEQAFQQKQFKDVAYFEPFYLKDFVATIPKKKIL